MSDPFSRQRILLGLVVAYFTAGGSALGAVAVPLAAELLGLFSQEGHGDWGQFFGGLVSGGTLGLLAGVWLVTWGLRLLKKVVLIFTILVMATSACALLLVQQGIIAW